MITVPTAIGNIFINVYYVLAFTVQYEYNNTQL